MIQIHRLEGFYWVARTGGYARAARAFPYPITQPAVHQQVKKLETELGLTLFERVAKDRMALTPGGQRLYTFVAPFFEGIEGVVRSLVEGDYGGELRIQTASLLLRTLMPAWIRRLHKKHPRVHVILQESYTDGLNDLLRGKVDLVVDHVPRVPPELASTQVALLRPFIVMPKGHRLAGRKRLALSAFGDDTFVTYNPDQLAHGLQIKALALHKVTPGRTLAAGTADSILGFVESGLGYSVLPSLEESGPTGRGIVSLPMTRPKVEFPVYVLWRKDAPENPLLDAALETAPKMD